MNRDTLHFGVFFFLSICLSVLAGTMTREVVFSENEIAFQRILGYDQITLPDASMSMEVGAPSLPRISIKLLIPAGATATSVNVVSFEKKEILGQYNILPAQPPERIDQSQMPSGFVPPNEKIYASSEPYPKAIFGPIHNGTKCGFRIADFFVYPIEYIPAKKQLSLYTKIIFEITFEENVHPMKGVTARQRDFWGKRVAEMVDNPEAITKWSPPVRRERPVRAALPAGNYEYVIISPNSSSWISAFQDLADWKTQKGVPAKVVNLQTDIYDDYSGDNQWKIKQFIADAVDDWGTLWVLIGADHGTDATNSIPCKGVWADDGIGDVDYGLPSERYYEDLDNDWNHDGDGVYGEHNDGPGGGELDWLADVYVGRMTANSATEVATHIDRILWFEKTPDAAFCKSAIFSSNQLSGDCSNYGYGYTRTDDWAEHVPTTWTLPGNATHPGYHVQQGIANWPGDQQFLQNYLSDGYQFYGTAGHGSNDGFNGDNCGSGQFITSTEVNSYLNPGMKCGIFVSMACSPGGFDNANCVVEYLYDKGMIGGAWNARYGIGYLNNDDDASIHQLSEGIVWQFFVQTFDQSPYHLSEAIAEAKDYFVTEISDDTWNWCLKEWNTWGDPELPMFTGDNVPLTLSVTHPAQVNIGANFDVTSTPSGAKVCCWMESAGFYEVATTPHTFTAPLSVGTIQVTVTKQDYKAYTGTIDVVNVGAPDAPTLVSPFDNARLGSGASSTTPTLSWNVPSDPDGDNLDFKVQWDDDEDFASPINTIESRLNTTGFSPTPPLAEGTGSCSYAINSQSEGALSNGTYWWRAAAYDGSNYGPWSEERSFTVNTGLSQWDWFQTTEDQWNTDSLSGAVVSGDAVELPSSPGGSEELSWDDGAGESYFSSPLYIATLFQPAEACTIKTARFHVKVQSVTAAKCSLFVWEYSGGSTPGSVVYGPISFRPSATGWYSIDLPTPYYDSDGQFWLGAFFPNRQNVLRYLYLYSEDNAPVNEKSYYSSSRIGPWTQDAGYDDETRAIVQYPEVITSSGSVTSTTIDFDEYPGSPSDWGTLSWGEDLTHGDITMDIQYWNGSAWANTSLINITDNTDYDISSLDPTTNRLIRLVGNLTASGGTPQLLDWTVRWAAASVGIELLRGSDSGSSYTAPWDLGLVGEGAEFVMSAGDRIFVKNTGDCPVDLSIIGSSPSWSMSSTGNGLDSCLVMGLFNGTSVPASGDFDIAHDFISEISYRDAGEGDSGNFATASNDGVNIAVGAGEFLYLYFKAPQPNNLLTVEDITITIKAEIH